MINKLIVYYHGIRLDDVEGLDLLRWEDQQKIRKYVEAVTSPKPNANNVESSIEVSQTYRAACKRCNEKILKGMVSVLVVI